MAVLWNRADQNALIARENEEKALGLARAEASAREAAQTQEKIAHGAPRPWHGRTTSTGSIGPTARSRMTTSRWPRTCCTAARPSGAAGSGTSSSDSATPNACSWISATPASTPSPSAPTGAGSSPARAPTSSDSPRQTQPLTYMIRCPVIVGRAFKGSGTACTAWPSARMGRKVAAGSGFAGPSGRGAVVVWDAERARSSGPGVSPGSAAMSVAFSPDGKSLAVGYGLYSSTTSGKVKIWDVASGKEIKTFPGPVGGVNKVAYHPEGKRLAAAGAGVVEIWDLETETKIDDQRAQELGLLCRLQPRREMAGDGGWDRTVRLWDAATGVGADLLRTRRIRPRPGLQPRRPHAGHGERGPERQALGGSFRPADRGVSRPYRLRSDGRLPALQPGDRFGKHGRFASVLGLADQPARSSSSTRRW